MILTTELLVVFLGLTLVLVSILYLSSHLEHLVLECCLTLNYLFVHFAKAMVMHQLAE